MVLSSAYSPPTPSTTTHNTHYYYYPTQPTNLCGYAQLVHENVLSQFTLLPVLPQPLLPSAPLLQWPQPPSSLPQPLTHMTTSHNHLQPSCCYFPYQYHPSPPQQWPQPSPLSPFNAYNPSPPLQYPHYSGSYYQSPSLYYGIDFESTRNRLLGMFSICETIHSSSTSSAGAILGNDTGIDTNGITTFLNIKIDGQMSITPNSNLSALSNQRETMEIPVEEVPNVNSEEVALFSFIDSDLVPNCMTHIDSELKLSSIGISNALQLSSTSNQKLEAPFVMEAFQENHNSIQLLCNVIPNSYVWSMRSLTQLDVHLVLLYAWVADARQLFDATGWYACQLFDDTCWVVDARQLFDDTGWVADATPVLTFNKGFCSGAIWSKYWAQAQQSAHQMPPHHPPFHDSAYPKRKLDKRYFILVDYYCSSHAVIATLANVGIKNFNLIVGIDYEKGNRSLHHIEGGHTLCDQTISITGQTLTTFSEDNLILCLGFGDGPWDMIQTFDDNIPSHEGSYAWLTYQDVYDAAMKMGSAMMSGGINPGYHCGIYGFTFPDWIIAMEACNNRTVTYVQLYDTCSLNTVEFIINHAIVSIAFVQEKKIPSILSCLDWCSSNLKNIVSFGIVSPTQKKEAEEVGTCSFSWGEFVQWGGVEWDPPSKTKTDICTIMYTS